jgi:hypothetical protein
MTMNLTLTLTFLRYVAISIIMMMLTTLTVTTTTVVNSLVIPKPTTILMTKPMTNHRHRDYINHINRINESRRRELNHKIITNLLSGNKK